MSRFAREIAALDRARRAIRNPEEAERRDTSPMMAVAPSDEKVEQARRWLLPREVRGTERGIAPFTPPGTDLAIYSWESEGHGGNTRYYAIAFHGRATKPLWHYSFKSEAERQEQINRTAESRHSGLAYRKDATAKRRAFAPTLKVGDFLYTSWGYDQTNVEFFEVVEASGKSVIIREVAQRTLSSDSGSDRVVPVPGQYIGEPMRKVVGQGNAVRIGDGRGHASPWDGKPKHSTSAGWGH